MKDEVRHVFLLVFSMGGRIFHRLGVRQWFTNHISYREPLRASARFPFLSLSEGRERKGKEMLWRARVSPCPSGR